MHWLTLEDDNKNSSYSIGKDENSQCPRQHIEVLIDSKYSTIEEKDRELHRGNTNQVENADRKDKLEKRCQWGTLVLSECLFTYFDKANRVLEQNYMSPGSIVYGYVSEHSCQLSSRYKIMAFNVPIIPTIKNPIRSACASH